MATQVCETWVLHALHDAGAPGTISAPHHLLISSLVHCTRGRDPKRITATPTGFLLAQSSSWRLARTIHGGERQMRRCKHDEEMPLWVRGHDNENERYQAEDDDL